MSIFLQVTRIGKLVNELRKKVKDDKLARRAKKLIQQWQKLVPGNSEISSGASTPNGQIKPRTTKSSEVALRLQGMTNVQRHSPLTSQAEQNSEVSTVETSIPPENGIETDTANAEVQHDNASAKVQHEPVSAEVLYEIDLDPPMFHRQWHGVDGREDVGHFFDWTVKMPMEGREDGVVQPYVYLEY